MIAKYRHTKNFWIMGKLYFFFGMFRLIP